MLIRSQNKKELHNLDKIKMISFIEISKKFYVEVNSQHTIGTYSTEEKAIKVLDMIQNKYFEHITLENNDAIVNVLERPKVFQMPQDSEV